jgi:hypothetical protein
VGVGRVYRDEGVGWWVGFKGTRELQAMWGVVGFTGMRAL